MSHNTAITLESPVDITDHVRGSAAATVTLLEYGDFECHYCGLAYPIVKELERRYGSALRFVYRHTPRSNMHPHAQHAAEAAEAAAAQGKFWEMHDWLFEHQSALGDADLIGYAKSLGLDESRFATEFRAHTYAPRVHAQAATGAHSVLATPTFFINGKRFDDKPDLAGLSLIISESLKSS